MLCHLSNTAQKVSVTVDASKLCHYKQALLPKECLFREDIIWHISVKVLVLYFEFIHNKGAEQESIRYVTNISNFVSKLVCECTFINLERTAML